MLTIDGSEGGGQLVRTAVALSALSGRPFRMTGIRETRPNPGLAAQHLAAVRTVGSIADADVSGDEPGSTALTFEPGTVRTGRYEADIGTAGSLTLLFDAVLPLAVGIDAPLAVAARGGTDVKWSPAMDYYRQVKLPLLRRHGVAATVDLDRRGFYPEGGGGATLWLAPSEPEPLDLVTAGPVEGGRLYSVASADLEDREVAERQATAAKAGLDSLEVEVVERTVQYADARSTGSAFAIRIDLAESRAGFDSLGERGRPAEAVAEAAVEVAGAFVESGAAVDAHLADQLAPFLGLVGGRLAIPAVTAHVETALTLLERFEFPVSVDRSGRCPVLSG